jgi:transposase-like protein
MRFPETLQECVRYFADEDRALNFMKAIRWADGVVRCPHCGSKDVAFMPARRIWRCRKDQKQFSVKVGTIMEDSPIGLDKWLCAFWLIVNAKNGISSYEIMRALGLTQKTSWFLLHRIRLAMQEGGGFMMNGEVEVDETYIGGRSRTMNNKQKARRKSNSSGQWNLEPVQGLLERTNEGTPSRVKLFHVKRNNRKQLEPNVRKHVTKGAEVFTDALKSYDELGDEYLHKVIDHAECYAKGKIHTNGLENFWSLLKRGLKGTYVCVEPFHLFRYLDEQAFRFNERKDNDAGRFLKAVAGYIGKRLEYAKLIGQGEDGGFLPPQTASAG